MIPLLSICIPTYNRAHLLESALYSLVPQVKAASPDVELIVSDNCSTDNTQEIVERAREWGPIRYHRNEENLGVVKNMLLTIELARGNFCWIIGDDDMVVKDKLPKLLRIIRANPDLDYFFVNYFLKPIQERNRLILENNSFYIPEKSECMCRDFSERRLDKWEELLDIDNLYPPGMYTAIVSHVFRRSIWCENAHILRIKEAKFLADFDATFPHIKILAHAMVGRPAYFIGDPIVLLGQGSQEWGEYWRLICVTQLPNALCMYERLGVEKAKIRPLQRILLDWECYFIRDMFIRGDMRGREYFSLRKFLWVNRQHPRKAAKILVLIVLIWMSRRMPSSIRTALKSTLDKMHIKL